MHFVISFFIACIILALAILFAEVFPKWFKIILTFIGAGTSGYALAILIRKIAMLTKIYSKPELWPATAICSAAMLIMIIAGVMVAKKKKA